jgi:hypothetical protein
MTDEERTELCDNLRSYEYTVYNQMAADEIKRLAALVESLRMSLKMWTAESIGESDND